MVLKPYIIFKSKKFSREKWFYLGLTLFFRWRLTPIQQTILHLFLYQRILSYLQLDFFNGRLQCLYNYFLRRPLLALATYQFLKLCPHYMPEKDQNLNLTSYINTIITYFSFFLSLVLPNSMQFFIQYMLYKSVYIYCILASTTRQGACRGQCFQSALRTQKSSQKYALPCWYSCLILGI